MVDQLNVSAEQKAKLDPILAKIKPILTDEQWTKLVQLREDRSKQDKKKK